MQRHKGTGMQRITKIVGTVDIFRGRLFVIFSETVTEVSRKEKSSRAIFLSFVVMSLKTNYVLMASKQCFHGVEAVFL